ncbi:MAG: response regulator transcription factor [Acidobacteria bacterium]|nr:response regulator transcription factor [Acidobacteriota bacterium]
MTTDEPVRVFILDDHAVVREGLAAIISRQQGMTVVGQAGSGREAIEMIEHDDPDVLIVDLRLPDTTGIEVIRAIRRRRPEVRLIVLSVYAGEEEIAEAIEAGAQAYLLKDVTPSELAHAIRTVMRGKSYVPATIASRLADRLTSPDLTSRETDVLRLMVDGKSKKEIASELRVGEATVKTHVANVMSKLGVRNRVEAVIAALERGIVHRWK